MRRLGLVTTVCCFIAIVLGCGGIGGFVHEQRLVGNVGLTACDEREQMCLSSFPEADGNVCRTLISETVFAVGWDESHVIAKRHPREFPGPIDKTQTEYFIVVVRDEKVHGPFDRAEFVRHCDLLGVAKDLDFTLTFEDLE